jgi:hypothetical protein
MARMVSLRALESSRHCVVVKRLGILVLDGRFKGGVFLGCAGERRSGLLSRSHIALGFE